jgi:hypothetical protein
MDSKKNIPYLSLKIASQIVPNMVMHLVTEASRKNPTRGFCSASSFTAKARHEANWIAVLHRTAEVGHVIIYKPTLGRVPLAPLSCTFNTHSTTN